MVDGIFYIVPQEKNPTMKCGGNQETEKWKHHVKSTDMEIFRLESAEL